MNTHELEHQSWKLSHKDLTHPFWVEFRLDSGHDPHCFDHDVKHIDQHDLKVLEGWFIFDLTTIQDEAQDEAWVFIGSSRLLEMKKSRISLTAYTKILAMCWSVII